MSTHKDCNHKCKVCHDNRFVKWIRDDGIFIDKSCPSCGTFQFAFHVPMAHGKAKVYK